MSAPSPDSAAASALYVAPHDRDDPDAPVALVATRCAACSRSFFPARRFGCPACGAEPDRLEDLEIPGRGTLRAFAIVRRSLFPTPPVPYAVAQVALDAGIETSVVVSGCDLEGLRPGMSLRARVVRAEDGTDRCYFVADSELG